MSYYLVASMVQRAELQSHCICDMTSILSYACSRICFALLLTFYFVVYSETVEEENERKGLIKQSC
jgi:hypothetical protein